MIQRACAVVATLLLVPSCGTSSSVLPNDASALPDRDEVADSGSLEDAPAVPIFSVSGSFNAFPFPVANGALFTEPETADAGAVTHLTGVATDNTASTCDAPLRGSETAMILDARTVGPILPQLFPVENTANPGFATVGISKLNPLCGPNPSMTFNAISGSMVITEVAATRISGTFDVVLENDAGTLQGTFNFPICAAAFSATCVR